MTIDLLSMTHADVTAALGPTGAKAFAALDGVGDDLASLAVGGMPQGTRMIAIEYGLVEEPARGEYTLTPEGRAYVKAATAVYPQPYADVDVAELLESAHAAVAALAERSEYEVEPVSRYQGQTVGAMSPLRLVGIAAARAATQLMRRPTAVREGEDPPPVGRPARRA
jgi:hypothetical protein